MRQTPSRDTKGETMKAYGMTAQELREIADAVATVEAYAGARLHPQEVGDVLGLYYKEDGAGVLDVACARLALALGDDRPEFRATLERVGR
jgi:hypothetical protein